MKFKFICISLFAVTVLCSCSKNADAPLGDVLTTKLNVINTTADTLNYYLNGTRQNSQSSIYTGGATGYLLVKSGTQNYQFRKYGRNEVLFSIPLTLSVAPDTVISSIVTNGTSTTNISTRVRGYSLYVTGETADKTFLAMDTVRANADSTTVRFVNTADGAPALDFYVGTTVSFINQGYGKISMFKTLIGGTNIVVSVYLTGGTVVKATQRINLVQSNVYTFYVKGKPDATGKAALTIGSFINNQ